MPIVVRYRKLFSNHFTINAPTYRIGPADEIPSDRGQPWNVA